MAKKLSLLSILEDIDLKKVKVKTHPVFNNIIESPVIGLYAWAQAYNKMVYKGIIDGPTLNINQINTPRTKHEQPGNLKFSKNSFKMDIDPEAEKISLFGNRGTEHDIIHLVTTNLAKHFARTRKSLEGESRFNKKMHHKARAGTPEQHTGPGPVIFGDTNFDELGQYAWPELVGNYLNDLVRSNVHEGMFISPERTSLAIIGRLKQAYTAKDRYNYGAMNSGIPEPHKSKMIDYVAKTLHHFLEEYNNFLTIYKRSAMVQQGMENPAPKFKKRKRPLPDVVQDIDDE